MFDTDKTRKIGLLHGEKTMTIPERNWRSDRQISYIQVDHLSG